MENRCLKQTAVLFSQKSKVKQTFFDRPIIITQLLSKKQHTRSKCTERYTNKEIYKHA